MFTLSPSRRASDGYNYFGKEDYYMNNPETSGWHGKGASDEPLTKNAGDDLEDIEFDIEIDPQTGAYKCSR